MYAAARDLPAGTSLRSEDLVVLRVRLPATALRHYLRPSPDLQVSGRVLTAPVRRETLVPAAVVLASSRDADLVELPVQVDQGDMAQGLRPGDSVQVLAAYTEGARRGRAVVLLPAAEVIQVLQDPAGLAATGQERGVQLRMPSDRAPLVVAAIATARIFVVKAPGRPTNPAATDPGDPASVGPGSAGSEEGDPDSTGPPPASPGPTPADPAEPEPSHPSYDDTEPASPGPTDPDTAAPGQGKASSPASLASKASSPVSVAPEGWG